MSAEVAKRPYRSCYYLESGISFLPHKIGFCCDRPSPASLPPFEDAGETVDAFLAMREQVIQENQTSTPPHAKVVVYSRNTKNQTAKSDISISVSTTFVIFPVSTALFNMNTRRIKINQKIMMP